MADEELQALEKLILGENPIEALQQFPTTSELKTFIQGLRLLSENPENPDIDVIIKKLASRNRNYSSKLQLRKWIKDYERTGSSQILEEINNMHLHYKFDYAPPRNVVSQEIETFPNTLNPVFPNFAEAQITEKVFDQLTAEGKLLIKFENTSDSIFKKYLSTGQLWKYKDFPERFVVYYRKNPGFTETECFKNISRSQLLKIAELENAIWTNRMFIRAWIRKEYFEKHRSMKDEAKYEYFKFIVSEIESEAKYPDSLKTIFFFNILILEKKLGKFEELWFMKYLQFHRNNNIYVNTLISDKDMKIFDIFYLDTGVNEQDLLDYYVRKMLEKNMSMFDELVKFINIDFLKKIQAEVLILKGEPIENIEKQFLNNSLLTSIELEPCADNPKEFTRAESVKFSMNIKNIPRVLVKVLELNPKNYFLKNNDDITTNIKLDGLVAKSEYTYEFKEPGQVRVRKEFEFNELAGKVGFFVIEFFGNSRQSRVIVKKGSLRYISKPTAAGHSIYVLNEENEVCKNAGLYLDSRYYDSKSEDGRIDIPFARASSNKNIILVDGEISELVKNFVHLQEQYELRTAFLIHEEQLIAGKTANIFLKPKVFVNGLKAPNALMKSSKAILKTTDIEGISSSKIYNDLEIPLGADSIEISFEVPPQIISLDISFSTEIESIDKIKTEYTSNYSTSLNKSLGVQKTSSLFLNFSNDSYLLELKGCNGEPVTKQRVSVSISHAHWNREFKQALQTNDQGKIFLGPLNNISKITATVESDQGRVENYVWIIKDYREKIEYPREIRLCEGDEFGLPVKNCGFNDAGEIAWLYSMWNDVVGDDYEKNLCFDKEKSMVTISGLEPGNYQLVFKDTLEAINVIVVDGVHFDKSFILKENSAMFINKDYMAIGISSVEVDENDVNVKVSGHFDERSMVYGLFFNYITPELYRSIQEFKGLNENEILGEMNFDRPRNIYLSSTLLDEEYQYVLDRKKQSKFIGSTLDKPQILLKRFFVKDTKTETQTAKLGEEYQKDRCYKSSSMMRMAEKCASCPQPIPLSSSISLDFLSTSAARLKSPIIDGKATFSIPGTYSNAFFIAYNAVGLAYKLRFLHGITLQKDLRLNTSAVDCTEICKSKALLVADELIITDFPNTSLEIVDNFSQLFSLIQEIITFNQHYPNIKEWSFLVDWPKLTFDKKKEYYDKYISHELNLFLRIRDKEFFETIAKPFVMCKMKKDIVDKYLCGEDLSDYANYRGVLSLNNLEKILIADNVKDKFPDFAHDIVKLLKDEADACEPDLRLRTKRIKAVLKYKAVEQAEKPAEMNECMYMDYPPSEERRPPPKMSNRMLASAERSTAMLRCSAPKKKMERKADLLENEDFEDEDEAMVLRSRIEAPKYYQKLEETKEFCETYYYGKKTGSDHFEAKLLSELGHSMITGTQWLSECVIESTDNLSKILLMLAYAAVPYKSERHACTSKDSMWKMVAKSPCIAFYKELGKAEVEVDPLVFIAVKYFTLNNNSVDLSQFIKETIYNCKVTITNTSGKDLNFTILTQVPEGSIALSPPQSSKTHFLFVSNFTTQTLEFSFYFPLSGSFTHIPGNIAVDGKIIAKAVMNTLRVLDVYDVSKLETFKDLVISGRKDLILDYLRTENLKSSKKNFSINDLFWMFKNKDFWSEVLSIYRSRLLYNEQLWSFAIIHNDKEIVSDILSSKEVIKNNIGHYFDSHIIKTTDEGHSHIEFDPLVNARAYKLGNQQRITNTRLRQVYKDFLLYLAEKNKLDDSDLICLCQYLVYQERYNEAKNLYSRIQMKHSEGVVGQGHLQIQYDYLTCYLDLDKAQLIAPLYENYPVPTWKKHFTEVITLLRELEEEDLPQTVTQTKEPTLSFEIQNNAIDLTYENVDFCIIRIYEIDLEVLFSKNPFLIQDTQSFGYVKANSLIEVQLTGKNSKVSLEEFKGKNVLVEVDYKTYSVSKSYFSNMLSYNCLDRFGVIKVMDSERKPRPAVYVKAFVKRKDGKVEFYKDGYTDVRGKFDYVSLNTDTLSSIEKFAILVVDDDLGSFVHEASPPPQ
ncbi:hypothetical protein SteCoe_29951 [Stentor coeruleus]|uniref:Uncharacterized protein n=1 Tax=Stentor coeruleus TaxID=5963 RepID=A0A1R2B4T4_9CILI|nr:hypothetical protein SteCoe_29951 [Stentor coeruleus]